MIYPSVARRYFAAFIDELVIYGLFYISSTLLVGNQDKVLNIIVVTSLVSYEPLFTSKFSTLGQLLMRFRVRSQNGYNNISLFQAYGRFALKVTLGIISLLFIPTDSKKEEFTTP